MDLKDFEKNVEQALKEIPQKFRDLLENITIEVDPSPPKSRTRLPQRPAG